MEKALESWCQNVVDFCNPKAEQLNLDYYCFQSAMPTFEPDLLIIGINPGGNGAFKKKRTKNELSQGYNIYDVREGHICPDNLQMVRKLSRVFTTPQLRNTLAAATTMNIYYFNTQNVQQMDSALSQEIRMFCQQKLRELIHIINPKHILFLCTESKELVTLGVKDLKGAGCYTKTGIFEGVKILALPNPGFYRDYSYANGESMGKIITEYLNL